LEVQATACINYNGEIVHNISADMLEDIKTLGKGRYGTVTLVQIAKYPHIRMAAKVIMIIACIILVTNVYFCRYRE
ncbi:unnamed protein product, partial [Didymodactylos carnosus]